MTTRLPVRSSTMTFLTLGQPLRQRLVRGRLQLNDVSAAPAAIGGNDDFRLGVDDPIPQRRRREPTEHHRMNGADASAGMHRDHRLRDQRHIDDHAIALLNALRAQRAGETTNLGVQLAIAQVARAAVLSLENDCSLVTALGQVHVQTIE